MKNMKLSNMQKESEKIKIKKKINEYEDKKAQVLLQIGIKAFDKIRKDELVDSDFNQMCEEIKNIDIEIYMNYMKLKSMERDKNTCECGYLAFKNEKFCPQCGKSLIIEEKNHVICENCNEETEEDSNYCTCCGSKIDKFIHFNKYNEYEHENNFENDEIEDSMEITEFQDLEVIQYNNENNYEENIDDEDIVVKEGREFLKSQQDSIDE